MITIQMIVIEMIIIRNVIHSVIHRGFTGDCNVEKSLYESSSNSCCCSFKVWIQCVLGLSLWCSLLIFRFGRLYVIVRVRNRRGKTLMLLTWLALWFLVLVYAIVCSVLNLDGPIDVDGVWMCNFEDIALYSFFGILLLYFLAFLVLIIRLRNIQQLYLREYKESTASFVFFLACYVMALSLVISKLQDHIWGRIAISLVVLVSFLRLFVFYSDDI